MKFRPIGKSGIEASVVALGTWGIGGGPNWADTDDAYSVGTIHKALDLGINMIDTAPVYGQRPLGGDGRQGAQDGRSFEGHPFDQMWLVVEGRPRQRVYEARRYHPAPFPASRHHPGRDRNEL